MIRSWNGELFKIFLQVFDNIQVALVFICLAFPNWLPEEYRKAKLFPDDNSTTFAIPRSSNIYAPAEGMQIIELYLKN